MRYLLYTAASIVAITGCSVDHDDVTDPSTAEPGSSSAARPGATLRDYIVVLKDGVDGFAATTAHARSQGALVSHRYGRAINGYAAKLTPAARAAIERDDRVRFVAEDRELFAATCEPSSFDPAEQCLPTGVDRIEGDRSSTRSGDGRGTVNVNVAVFDTGIDAAHPDLNVVGGIACAAGKGFGDQHGHGTHVAGIIGARDNGIGVVGVAPGARLWAVRVLNKNGAGSASSIICGIEWATSTRTDTDPTNDVVVANMSLAGKGSDDGNCGRTNKDPLHLAICNSTAAGVSYVVAAGNESKDLAGLIPASYGEALTVTAISDFDGTAGTAATGAGCAPAGPVPDQAAVFSNFATLPDDRAHTVAAPGDCILSTDLTTGGFTGYTEFSGTSQATPHVAGTVALCIASGACAGRTPVQIVETIVRDAAAHTTAHPGYGYTGDPLRPDPQKYFGFLIRAAAY